MRTTRALAAGVVVAAAVGFAAPTAMARNEASVTVAVRGGQDQALTRPAAVSGAVRGLDVAGGNSTGATPTDMAIGGGLVVAAVIGGAVCWLCRRSEDDN
jgi:hypothetical protein